MNVDVTRVFPVVALLLGTNWSFAAHPTVKSADILLSYVTDLDSPNTPASTEVNDFFSYALAAGDFDDDGMNDLAVSVPGKNFNGVVPGAGAVVVFYGKYASLPTHYDELIQTLVADSDGVEENDNFGVSLASGDFDGDGFDDLAVGTPNEDVILDFNDPINSNHVDAGAINVFYGSEQGLSAVSDYIHMDTDVTFGGSLVQTNAQFGTAMAAGDLTGDGRDELIVAAHNYDVHVQGQNDIVDAGVVLVYRGHPLGIRGGDRVYLDQNNGALIGVSEPFDTFGWALSVGYFNNDTFADLAIGVPSEDYNGVTDAGVVQVIMGDASLIMQDDSLWSQQQLSGVALETNDQFGFSIAAGDFKGDGIDDLVVGVPYEDLEGATDGGVVHVINGIASGLTATENITLSQDSGTLFGIPETGDAFGSALATGDLDLDGFDELIIGTPLEDTSVNSGGLVHVVFGESSGLGVSETLHYLSDNEGATLGNALVVGDFGYGQTLQMAQAGRASLDMDLNAGALFSVVYQNPYLIFKNGFESSLKLVVDDQNKRAR